MCPPAGDDRLFSQNRHFINHNRFGRTHGSAPTIIFRKCVRALSTVRGLGKSAEPSDFRKRPDTNRGKRGIIKGVFYKLYRKKYLLFFRVYIKLCKNTPKNPPFPPFYSLENRAVLSHRGMFVKSVRQLLHKNTCVPYCLRNTKKAASPKQDCLFITVKNYSLIAITAPEPTVLPPSRIAKRRPTSIAIGVISSTSISTLSPGMHISVPSGREITPVTSVVLK